MATAKKITELNASNTVSNSDLLVVEINPATTPATRKITIDNFVSSVSSNIPGPHDDDAAAATANVAVSEFYYTSSGVVKIRLA